MFFVDFKHHGSTFHTYLLWEVSCERNLPQFKGSPEQTKEKPQYLYIYRYISVLNFYTVNGAACRPELCINSTIYFTVNSQIPNPSKESTQLFFNPPKLQLRALQNTSIRLNATGHRSGWRWYDNIKYLTINSQNQNQSKKSTPFFFSTPQNCSYEPSKIHQLNSVLLVTEWWHDNIKTNKKINSLCLNPANIFVGDGRWSCKNSAEHFIRRSFKQSNFGVDFMS